MKKRRHGCLRLSFWTIHGMKKKCQPPNQSNPANPDGRKVLDRPRAAYFNGTQVGHEYSAEDMEFLKALEQFKQKHRIKFPSAIDHLNVARSLGYRKTIHVDVESVMCAPSLDEPGQ